MAEIKGIADGVGEFACSHDKLLKEMGATVKQYASEELKRDIPTGNYNINTGFLCKIIIMNIPLFSFIQARPHSDGISVIQLT